VLEVKFLDYDMTNDSLYSTSVWIEEVMVRRFAAWSFVSIALFALIAMLSL